MLEAQIMERMKIQRLISKEKLALELHESVNANLETVFRTLRRLAEEKKITYIGGGYYRYNFPKDDKTRSLTKWLK
jgi:Fe2+ or Zn2+ uptake regulation protein